MSTGIRVCGIIFLDFAIDYNCEILLRCNLLCAAVGVSRFGREKSVVGLTILLSPKSVTNYTTICTKSSYQYMLGE